MSKLDIYVVKSSGERELFSEEKLRHSLEKSQASPELVNEVVSHLNLELRDGMPTAEIYKRAFTMLKKHRRSLAARYSLQKAILQMGPTGYPFEMLVGEILKHQGFSVEISKIMQGLCVSHEIDVAAVKGSQHIIVECKFHNELEMKSDVKVALYVHARFEDIGKAWNKTHNNGEYLKEAWLVTNTRLTSDAIRYSHCVGINAIDWNYPQGNSLSELIDRAGLHPITSLTSLNRIQKQQMMDNGIILCRQLLENPHILSSAGIDALRTSRILKEAGELSRERKTYE